MSVDDQTNDDVQDQQTQDQTSDSGDNKPELSDAHKKDIREKKNALERARQAEDRAKAAEAKLQEIADANAEREAAEQESELTAKGKYEEALEAKKAAHDKELAERDQRIELVEAAMRREFGTNCVMAALGDAGVKSELIHQAAQLLDGRFKVELADGTPQITALGEDGKELFIEGEPATIADLAADFAKRNPHFLPPTGDTGSGATKGGPGAVTIEQLDADPEAKVAFIQKHGQKAYLQLAKQKQRK